MTTIQLLLQGQCKWHSPWLVGRSVHHFGSDWNILTTIWYPLTFPQVQGVGLFCFLVTYPDIDWMDCYAVWYRYSTWPAMNRNEFSLNPNVFSSAAIRRLMLSLISQYWLYGLAQHFVPAFMLPSWWIVVNGDALYFHLEPSSGEFQYVQNHFMLAKLMAFPSASAILLMQNVANTLN